MTLGQASASTSNTLHPLSAIQSGMTVTFHYKIQFLFTKFIFSNLTNVIMNYLYFSNEGSELVAEQQRQNVTRGEHNVKVKITYTDQMKSGVYRVNQNTTFRLLLEQAARRFKIETEDLKNYYICDEEDVEYILDNSVLSDASDATQFYLKKYEDN
jgi:hypothetical protein